MFQSPSGTVVQQGRARSLSTTWNEVCQSPRMTRSTSMVGSRDGESSSLHSSASMDKPIAAANGALSPPCSISAVCTGSMSNICVFCTESNRLLGHCSVEEMTKKSKFDYDHFDCLTVLSNVIKDLVGDDRTFHLLQVASCLVKDVMTVSYDVLHVACTRYESILDNDNVPASLSTHSSFSAASIGKFANRSLVEPNSVVTQALANALQNRRQTIRDKTANRVLTLPLSSG
eukprot:TRINITY_DN1719_c0_g2_i6.p1 TRINITY_DN1719_c0_g2~~TRINITY_DN1719_c0_g2_i6.p1  ORF type:complete len:231 (+),score=39.38 TRINITY_DN1719_c0_g2_i6:1154-1846(+)